MKYCSENDEKERFDDIMLLMCSDIIPELYESTIEWILKHIVIVYAIEIILIMVLFVSGIVCENGFGVCGY